MKDAVRSSESRVINGRRYRVVDVTSRDCRTLHCVREAELHTPYCHVCERRREDRRNGRAAYSRTPLVYAIMGAMTR